MPPELLAVADAAAIADRFDAGVERALRARRRGRRLVSVTAPLEGEVDPAAVVFSTRRATDRWLCWEQPHSGGFALAALGSAWDVVSRGEDRFRDAARAAADLLGEHREAGPDPDLPSPAGPVLVGGFGFWPDAGRSSVWSSFPPALLTLPELSLTRAGGSAHLTVNAAIADAAGAEAARARVHARLAALADWRPLPLLDPHVVGSGSTIESVRPPQEFERSVERACERMRATPLRKVVLAREVVVRAPRAHDPAAVFGALRDHYRSCYCFCVGTPEAAFVGASPELLVRRRGAGVWTVALASSTRRSADPSVDRHLGEQLLSDPKTRTEHEIVVERIVAKLRRMSVWVQRAETPEVVKVENIQHLGTAIHAQLREPASAVELAGELHPTPAVGGEPWDLAAPAIRELEDLDRGWYAAPVGWMDATDDGELCVGIRSALLRDRTAHLFVGNGIVPGSDPRAELAETEVKLQALLPLLAG
ncbi:MAG TPA: isochorismate synthase [Thermoleophilaceae bacterium]|jgi:salicylate biosynthesis isochorismate synthase/menaquinone-specific isochorismate synthase